MPLAAGVIAAVVLVSGVVRSGASSECSKSGGPRTGSPLGPSRHAWANDRRRLAMVFAAGKVTMTLALVRQRP